MGIPKLEDYRLYFVKIKKIILEGENIKFKIIDIRTTRPEDSDYGLAFGYVIKRWNENGKSL